MTADPLSITAADRLPKFTTNFDGYSPRFNVTAVAARMVSSVPQNLMHGLGTVVFTNMSALSRKRRRSRTRSRNRAGRIENAAGLYHSAWNGNLAWVEVFVDKTMNFPGRFGWLVRIPFLRDLLLSRVLFHEIGHHIYATARPEFREKEDVAEEWRVKLQRRYFRQYHSWLVTVISILKRLKLLRPPKSKKNGTNFSRKRATKP